MRSLFSIKCVALVATLLHITNCASYTDETRDIRSLYRSGQFAAADKKIEKSALKEQSRNRLLYQMEKAMILDRSKQRGSSRKLLLGADQLADKLYTTSISKEALTYLYNDSAQDYAGEDYEKVAIHAILALSFLEDDNTKSAAVEARKINSKLNEINDKYDEKKNRYAEDAFARYLAGAIHESQGNMDSAIIDYRKALALYEGIYSTEFGTGVPDQVVESLYSVYARRGRRSEAIQLSKKYSKILSSSFRNRVAANAKLAQVLVIHELGTIAVKEAKDFPIPFGKQLIRLSFPIIKPKRGYWPTARVSVGGKTHEGERVQNYDLIAAKTLEDRRLRLVLKQGARLLAKGQITEQAYKNFGPVGGIAANVYSFVTETADTRGWTLLPRGFYATRLYVKPGKQVLKLTSGLKSQTKTIMAKQGGFTILRSKG